jgi:hypothetical protein
MKTTHCTAEDGVTILQRFALEETTGARVETVDFGFCRNDELLVFAFCLLPRVTEGLPERAGISLHSTAT